MQRAPDVTARGLVASNLFSVLETERLGEKPQVAPLVLGKRVAAVVRELELGGDAADSPIVNPALAAQSLGWIAAETAVADVLQSVARLAENHRVKVDLPAAFVAEDEPRREPGHVPGGVCEAGNGKRALRLVEILTTDDEIEIVVCARLAPEQGVDPPATVDPDLNACCFEPLEDDDGVGGRHPDRFSLPWRFA
jgi:hypothetical protein